MLTVKPLSIIFVPESSKKFISKENFLLKTTSDITSQKLISAIISQSVTHHSTFQIQICGSRGTETTNGHNRKENGRHLLRDVELLRLQHTRGGLPVAKLKLYGDEDGDSRGGRMGAKVH